MIPRHQLEESEARPLKIKLFTFLMGKGKSSQEKMTKNPRLNTCF